MQDVVFVATRKIVRPPKKVSAVQRPRTRTLTAVHDGILEDVVYPAEIVGNRIRYRLDGAKVIKVNSATFENTDYHTRSYGQFNQIMYTLIFEEVSSCSGDSA